MQRKFIILTLLLSLALAGCGEDRPGYDLISKTWDKHYSASSWETGPLYGGTAVIMNEVASYWVKDGTVYACNGIAMGSSPGVPWSPPSVDNAAVEAAIRGNAPAMPPAFAMLYTEFTASMMREVEPLGFKREHDLLYRAPGAQFQVEEAGGQLTKADMSFRAEKGQMELPLKTLIAFFKTAAPGISDQEVSDTIAWMLRESVQNLGSPQQVDGYGALFTMTASGTGNTRYVEVTATPHHGEQ